MNEFKEEDHFLTNYILGVDGERFPCVGIVTEKHSETLYLVRLLNRRETEWCVHVSEMRKIESEEELLRLLFLDRIGKLTKEGYK